MVGINDNIRSLVFPSLKHSGPSSEQVEVDRNPPGGSGSSRWRRHPRKTIEDSEAPGDRDRSTDKRDRHMQH
jgi:hypothetical protein